LRFLAPLLFVANGAWGQSPIPVALDVLPSSGLAVVDSSGKVSEVTLGKAAAHKSRLLFRLADGESPVDMTLGQFNGQYYLFVLTRPQDGSDRGTIHQFAYPSGAEVKPAVSLTEMVTGIDYDESADALYFVSSHGGRLFRTALCDRSIVLVGSLPDIGKSGPLGVRTGRVSGCGQADKSGSVLYVGDALNGAIYEYKVTEKTVAKVSKYIGAVTAELVARKNANFPTLYASDSTRHLIVPFAIQHNGSLIAQPWVAQDGHLNTPSGIALLNSVNVVSDLIRSSLVVYDPNWKFLYEIKGTEGSSPTSSPW